MRLKYVGKRGYIAQDYCHKRYAFSKENDYVCEVPVVVATKLIATGEYLPAEAEKVFEEKEIVRVDDIVEVPVKSKRKATRRCKAKKTEE